MDAQPEDSIEPGGRGRRPPGMRKVLSTIFRLAGFALGLGATGILIALQWPDVMGDLYAADSLRHFVRMFMSGIVLGIVICWPFWWVAGKLFPEDRIDNVDLGAPPGRHQNEHRHAD